MHLNNSFLHQVAHVIILLAMIVLPASAWAAPTVSNVSGTVSHGQQITIYGTGFGLHPNHNYNGTWRGRPFLNRAFTDFEGGKILGDQFTNGGGQDANLTLQTSGNKPNSAYYVRKSAVVGHGGGLDILSYAQHNEWYTSFWFRMPAGATSGKPVRIWSGTSGNDVTLFAGGYSGDTNLRGTDGQVTQWGSAAQLQYGVWQRIEFYMRDVSSIDREVTTWINGSLAWSNVNKSGAWPPNYPYNDNGHTWNWIGYYDGPGGSYEIDDIFVNHTRARVELGNASTWAQSTHREVQIPNTWSAESITVTVNQGSLSAGQTCYLYVVDSAGVVNSQGYPVRVGGGAGSPPSPPTGLQVIP